MLWVLGYSAFVFLFQTCYIPARQCKLTSFCTWAILEISGIKKDLYITIVARLLLLVLFCWFSVVVQSSGFWQYVFALHLPCNRIPISIACHILTNTIITHTSTWPSAKQGGIPEWLESPEIAVTLSLPRTCLGVFRDLRVDVAARAGFWFETASHSIAHSRVARLTGPCRRVWPIQNWDQHANSYFFAFFRRW